MSELVDRLLAENAEILQGLTGLLLRLDDDAFNSAADPCYGSTIGEQVRHTIEHAEALLAAPGGTVDFHARQRDVRTETMRTLAIERLDDVINSFEGMRQRAVDDTLIRVRHVIDCSHGLEDHWLDTSLSRELAFLQSHSIHHMALIGVMASLAGINVPEGFGVAPSTRRYLGAEKQREREPGGGDQVVRAASNV
ncbi:DinB family protein [Aquisalimonas sp. 2447]|uniref:DinB family protein n=1 Tax=Aquisalimonas sp. 2447 TaxID=2740807 RepID=UPI00143263CC|nr:DinB family protein [Aquisalimonas sp. 2447]QIT56084.1 DinB family protein [Aquisalimonas sp. 2447]